MVMAVSGCASIELSEFPADYYYELDTTNKICGKWKIISKDAMVVNFVRDMPLDECNGVIGFRFEDMGKVRRWIKEAQK